MKYSDIIQNLSNNILNYFDEVYHNAEIVTTDKEKFPAISKENEWINLSPTDQQEMIYIRRNGDDQVYDDMKLGGCIKAYKMQSPLRIVFFKDHAEEHNKIIAHLMQSVLISGTKLNRIIQDKWSLYKTESSGEYVFNPKTAYFAIDIYALWDLMPDTCEEDYCVELENPMKCAVTV